MPRLGYWLYSKIYPGDIIGPVVVQDVFEEPAEDGAGLFYKRKLVVKVQYPKLKKQRFTTRKTICYGIFWDYGHLRKCIEEHYKTK